MEESTLGEDWTVDCKECNEELVKDDNGDWPEECDFCGTPTGLTVIKQCPNCSKDRIRSKTTGKYAVRCRYCKHTFTDAGPMTVSMTSSMLTSSAPPYSITPLPTVRSETKPSGSEVVTSPQLHADSEMTKSGMDGPKEIEINNQLTDKKLFDILREEETVKSKLIHKESDATKELEADGQQAYAKTLDDEETAKTANAGNLSVAENVDGDKEPKPPDGNKTLKGPQSDQTSQSGEEHHLLESEDDQTSTIGSTHTPKKGSQTDPYPTPQTVGGQSGPNQPSTDIRQTGSNQHPIDDGGQSNPDQPPIDDRGSGLAQPPSVDEERDPIQPSTDGGQSGPNQPPTDDGQIDPNQPPPDRGQSGPNHPLTDGGQGEPHQPPDDRQSGSSLPPSDGGQSEPNQPPIDAGQISHNQSPTDSGQSDPIQPPADGGQCDLHQPPDDRRSGSSLPQCDGGQSEPHQPPDDPGQISHNQSPTDGGQSDPIQPAADGRQGLINQPPTGDGQIGPNQPPPGGGQSGPNQPPPDGGRSYPYQAPIDGEQSGPNQPPTDDRQSEPSQPPRDGGQSGLNQLSTGGGQTYLNQLPTGGGQSGPNQLPIGGVQSCLNQPPTDGGQQGLNRPPIYGEQSGPDPPPTNGRQIGSHQTPIDGGGQSDPDRPPTDDSRSGLTQPPTVGEERDPIHASTAGEQVGPNQQPTDDGQTLGQIDPNQTPHDGGHQPLTDDDGRIDPNQSKPDGRQSGPNQHGRHRALSPSPTGGGQPNPSQPSTDGEQRGSNLAPPGNAHGCSGSSQLQYKGSSDQQGGPQTSGGRRRNSDDNEQFVDAASHFTPEGEPSVPHADNSHRVYTGGNVTRTVDNKGLPSNTLATGSGDTVPLASLSAGSAGGQQLREKTSITQHPPKFIDILRILRDNNTQQHDKRPFKDKSFLRTTLTKAEKLYKDHSKCLTEFKNAKQSKKRDKEQKLIDMYGLLANFADEKKNELDSILGKQRDLQQSTVSHHPEHSSSWSVELVAVLQSKEMHMVERQELFVQVEIWNGRNYVFATTLEKDGSVLRGRMVDNPNWVPGIYYRYKIYNPKDEQHYLETVAIDNNSYRWVVKNVATRYDGLITPDIPRSRYQRVMSMFASNKTPYEQKIQAFPKILPNWADSIRRGEDAEELRAQVEEVVAQQITHCQRYNTYPQTTRTDIMQVLRGHMIQICHQHRELCKETLLKWRQKFLSLIAITRLLEYLLKDTNSATDLVKSFEGLVQLTTFQLDGAHSFYSSTALLSAIDSTTKNILCHTLRSLMNLAERFKYVDLWMELVPLYHTMSSMNINTHGDDYDDPLWWGLDSEMKGQVGRIKAASQTVDWKKWLSKLKPYIVDHPLTAFTLLACLQAEQMRELLDTSEKVLFPPNAILACARYHLKHEKEERNKKIIYELLKKYFCTISETEMMTITLDGTTSKLSCELLDLHVTRKQTRTYAGHLSYYDSLGAAAPAAGLFLTISDLYISQSECSVEDLDMITAVYTAFVDGFKRFTTELYRGVRGLKDAEMQSWKDMMNSRPVSSSKLKYAVSNIYLTAFKDRINEFRDRQQELLNLYMTRDFAHPEMSDALAEYAISSAETLLMHDSQSDWQDRHDNKKVRGIVNLAMDRAWPFAEDLDDKLNIVDKFVELIQWGQMIPLTRFWDNLSEDQRTQFDIKNQIKMYKCMSIVDAVVDSLTDKELRLRDLHKLAPHFEKLIDCIALLKSYKDRVPTIRETFENGLAKRRKYMEFRAQFNGFWAACSLSVTDEIRDVVEPWLDRDVSLFMLAECIDDETGNLKQDFLPRNILEILGPCNTYVKRTVFSKLFNMNISHQGQTWEMISDAYEKTLQTYLSDVQKFTEGAVSINEVEQYCSKYFGENKANFKDELKAMIGEQQGLIRLRELEGARELAVHYDAAQVMISLKLALRIGDHPEFNRYGRILEAKADAMLLKDFNAELIPAEPIIANHARLECLKAFTEENSLKFLQWIKKAVPRKDIDVFVDIASSTMGEDALAAQKTTYLLNCLHGYAPLIYEFSINDDDKEPERDLDFFWSTCEQIWTHLAENAKLPDNLRKSAGELEHLKEVKDHYGNVEIDSITQATAINQTGKYYVGNIPEYSKQFKSEEDVVKLVAMIEQKTGQDQITKEKTFDYSELKELQSKLTLVATDRQKENMDTIHSFDAMRDAVENLAKAYLDIRREGCIQFDDLLVVIHCSPLEDDGKVAMEVRLVSVAQTMHGFKFDKKALEHCQDLYNYLKDCLRKWRASMDEKRSEIKELNYFTTEQIVQLRKELGLFHYHRQNGEDYKLDKTLPLLAMIMRVGSDQIQSYLSEYREYVNAKQPGDADEVFISYEEMDSDQQDKVYQVVYADDARFDQELAVKAVNQIGFEAEDDDYIEWLDNYQRELESQKKEERSKHERDSAAVLKSIFEEEVLTSSLQTKLNNLWNRFIAHTGRSIRDLLSVEHLGHLLTKLHELLSSTGVSTGRRGNPEWMRRGRPCLLAVPKQSMLSMVLTIYGSDKEYAPPTRNEVMLCNEKTTVEQVTLFMNRALKDNKSIYTMAFCEKLSFSACKEIELRTSKLSDNENKQFGLVFLYAKEEPNARIRAYLDKYLVKTASQLDQDQIREYVLNRIFSQESGNSANTVDPEELIRSEVAGVGKSLYRQNLCDILRETAELRNGTDLTIPIYRHVNTDAIVAVLRKHLGNGFKGDVYDTIHIDVAFEVESGVDELLFNLLVLKSIVDSDGVVWQALPTQYYVIESMPHMSAGRCAHELFEFLPTTRCSTPEEVYRSYTSDSGHWWMFTSPHNSPNKQLPIQWVCEQATDDRTPYRACLDDDAVDIQFDERIFKLEQYQQVFKYLSAYEEGSVEVQENCPFDSKKEGLRLLLRHCGLKLKNPSWCELRHFIFFLHDQLERAATNPFCMDEESLPGFKKFVLGFMLQMSQDFATRSLKIAERNVPGSIHQINVVEDMSMKKNWETSDTPYLFFNEDGTTFTTLGFYVEIKAGERNCSLIDIQSQPRRAFKGYTIPRQVYTAVNGQLKALDKHDTSLKEDFNALPRNRQLEKLRKVMVKDVPFAEYTRDPNQHYVLTMDNAKKILAIHQRLRVGIPIIIMGETGCGKTMLIDFMSQLQVPNQLHGQLKTMHTLKVHGGTTAADVMLAVKAAMEQAEINRRICDEFGADWRQERTAVSEKNIKVEVYTILFLDEANTTEAIGLIKEILCDKRMNGVDLDPSSTLRIIAACNPYRRHDIGMINKLKEAGLGYKVEDNKTQDTLGKIPMRHLVYRVQPLPQSLMPLVWDFGTLRSGQSGEANSEAKYIGRMVEKFNQKPNQRTGDQDNSDDSDDDHLDFGENTDKVTALLSMSQNFMREQKDECSFVSLRDIERLLTVSAWFYSKREKLFPMIDDLTSNTLLGTISPEIRSLMLSIGVCYMARLEEASRKGYSQHIASALFSCVSDVRLDMRSLLEVQLEMCQEAIINEVVIKGTQQTTAIAKNKALKENVFMMIVCIENRIPLFVVGKPGSSKSLSKALVLDSMKGNTSANHLFKTMKSTHMVSFQCSRHATAEGIIGVFKLCATYQKKRDIDKFVSVVVLDEVGLAEDSENMPLKTLHPLLEDGCDGVKCGFIGISNWALDPAKMNRGIFVQRGALNSSELQSIAREICSAHGTGDRGVSNLIDPLTKAYIKTCEEQRSPEREATDFYGLRDFYSLMKMIAGFASQSATLTKEQLQHSIMRNFGGFEQEKFNPLSIFGHECQGFMESMESAVDHGDPSPPVEQIELIDSCLSGKDTQFPGIESRYLLILTESLSVLSIITDMLAENHIHPEVVFGSRFKDDFTYTQVCHNIYRIKTCMDLGRPVILLNLDDLYESLYDALNQYFSTWGDKKFVDLGLGTHRVKAFVKEGFRLIVIAEKSKVHEEFPIPLINRLEKHYVSATTLLDDDEKKVKRELETWMRNFAKPDTQRSDMCPAICEAKGCERELNKPYKLPGCGHYVGEHCLMKIQRMMARGDAHATYQCLVENCTALLPEPEEMNDLEINVVAQRNRDYFENSNTVESIFIGFSSELTALAIRKHTDSAVRGSQHKREYRKLLLTKAKEQVLQCAIGEAVLRLKHTRLKTEASILEHVYMTKQCHETLLQYYQKVIEPARSPQFIQITTFSEVMAKTDVEMLHSKLNRDGSSCELKCLYLTDYAKEKMFADALRKFYEKETQCQTKLVIVQCESAHENTELLDVARFIIQRESSESFSSQETKSQVPIVPTHTVLLLSLPRGCTFTGYQGGVWQCVHIDDPRSVGSMLPSFTRCLNLRPSAILKDVLIQLNGDEHLQVDDEYADMPMLEEEHEENDGIATIPDEEYPDPELLPTANITARPIAEPEDTTERISVGEVQQFLKYCIPTALSLIKPAKTDRVLMLQEALDDNSSSGFFESLIRHMNNLLAEQDEVDPTNWVKDDAAKASNMKKSGTLRHAIEDAFERALVPAMAAVISFVDIHDNIELLQSDVHIRMLWLRIFASCESHLNFDTVRSSTERGENLSRLPKSYRIPSFWNSTYSTQFPFSWIVKQTLDERLSAVLSLENTHTTENDDPYSVLLEWFGGTSIGSAIAEETFSGLSGPLVQRYLRDFIHMKHPTRSEDEMWIIQELMQYKMKENESPTVALVHVVYHDIESIVSNITDLTRFTQETSKSKAIPTQLKQFINSSEHSLDTPADLYALSCSLKILKGDYRLKELTVGPEAWIEQIEHTKKVMDRIITPDMNDTDFGGLPGECRVSSQVLELKKLYLLHVIIPGPVKNNNGKNPLQLPKLMKTAERGNFNEIETFKLIIEFLKNRLNDSILALYPNCAKKCPLCKNDMHNPIHLECDHFVCLECSRSELCPVGGCGKTITKNLSFNPSTDDIGDDLLEAFASIRERIQNFMRHFISTLVFRQHVHPDEGIVKWLFDYVTDIHKTRENTYFDHSEVLMPNQFMRGFILKLFLGSDECEFITQSLNEILQGQSSSSRKIMMLVVDCYNDLLKVNEEPESAVSGVNTFEQLLRGEDADINVNCLKAISDVQRKLSTILISLTTPKSLQLDSDFKQEFFDLLAEIFPCNQQLSYYMIRQMFAMRGLGCIKDIITSDNSALIPQNLVQVLSGFEVPDLLTEYGGDMYTQAKEESTRLIINASSSEAFNRCLVEFCETYEPTESNVTRLLAMFPVITRSPYGSDALHSHLRSLIFDTLSQRLKGIEVLTLKVLMGNTPLPDGLNVTTTDGIHMFMLILRLIEPLSNTSNGHIYPLVEIVQQSATAKEHLMPTMDDDFMDVEREAQKSRPALSWGGKYGNNSILYKCPNGHPYLISDCGKAWSESKCLCGAVIGGRRHETASSNQRLDDQEQNQQLSKPGHILGHASNRPQTAQPQRDLSPLSCAILRCITHLSMLLSAVFNGNEKVAQLIQEERPGEDNLCDFLVKHINIDLAQISDCAEKNIDDCYLLLHEVITSLQNNAPSVESVPLQSIAQRGEWEKNIDSSHIQPVLECLDQRLSEIRSRLEGAPEAEFKRIISTSVELDSSANVMALPCLWHYKRPITLSVIRGKIEDKNEELFALNLVVKQCDELIAIGCLPDIIELTSYLSEKLHSKFSRKQAQTTSIHEFLDQPEQQHLSRLVERAIYASDVMIQKGHSEDSGNQNGFRPLTMESPLAEFLYDKRALKPGNNDAGSAPFILASYLINKHNNLLQAVDHRNNQSDITRTRVKLQSLNEVMPSHLVSLTDPDEVLHLVLTHSEYEIDDPSNVEFNWTAMEHEVVVKYFGNRPTILHSMTDLPSYMYSDDFNLLSQMKALGETQERLDMDSHANVSSGLNQSVQALTDFLKEVEVVFNFLAISVSDNIGTMEQSLLTFMKSIFGGAREFVYLTPDVKMKHVKHVWFILRFTQAGLLTNQRQEPFDDVEPSYREGLTPAVKQQLQECCSYNSIRTKALLQELFEFVIIKLNRTSASNIYDQPDPKSPLYDLLRHYIEEQHFEDPERMMQILGDLPELPKSVETRHAAKAWAFIWTCYNRPPSTQAPPEAEAEV